MKLHHYLWAVAAACMLLPGCSNEDLSDHASAPVFIPGNSEVEIRFAAHSDEVSTSVDKRATVDEDGNLDEMGVFCLARGKQEKNDGDHLVLLPQISHGPRADMRGNLLHPFGAFALAHHSAEEIPCEKESDQRSERYKPEKNRCTHKRSFEG